MGCQAPELARQKFERREIGPIEPFLLHLDRAIQSWLLLPAARPHFCEVPEAFSFVPDLWQDSLVRTPKGSPGQLLPLQLADWQKFQISPEISQSSLTS
jgi:hypothetical protein